MEPPIAIICKWRDFSLLDSGESAVAFAALSTSKTLPSAPTAPGLVMVALGSLLKLLTKRLMRVPALVVRESPS
jgi:hypothetical protein